jgi:hypothetical protein
MDVLKKGVSVAALRVALQSGEETFDFVQEIAIRENLDQVGAANFTVPRAQGALHGIIFFGHGFLGGSQDSATPNTC